MTIQNLLTDVVHGLRQVRCEPQPWQPSTLTGQTVGLQRRNQPGTGTDADALRRAAVRDGLRPAVWA